MNKILFCRIIFCIMLMISGNSSINGISSKQKKIETLGVILLIGGIFVSMYYINKDNEDSKKKYIEYKRRFKRFKRSIVSQMRVHKKKLKILLKKYLNVINMYGALQEAVIQEKKNKKKLDMIKIVLLFVISIGIASLLGSFNARNDNQYIYFNNINNNEIDDQMIKPLTDYENQQYECVIKIINKIFYEALLWEPYKDLFRSDFNFLYVMTNKYKIYRMLNAIVFEELMKWLKEDNQW